MTMAPMPSAVRQTAGTSIGAMLLWAICPTQGIAFCAKNPPRFPALLIAPIAAAPRAPLK